MLFNFEKSFQITSFYLGDTERDLNKDTRACMHEYQQWTRRIIENNKATNLHLNKKNSYCCLDICH